MARKHHSPEQVIAKLRQAEVELAKGRGMGEVCRELEVSDKTLARWRKEYGGLRIDQAKRFKDIERENIALKRLVADQALDIVMLKDLNSKNF